MFFEEGPDNRRREKIVTHIRAEGGKRIHLRNPSGLNLQLDIGQDALLTEELTPHKKILQKTILDTLLFIIWYLRCDVMSYLNLNITYLGTMKASVIC